MNAQSEVDKLRPLLLEAQPNGTGSSSSSPAYTGQPVPMIVNDPNLVGSQPSTPSNQPSIKQHQQLLSAPDFDLLRAPLTPLAASASPSHTPIHTPPLHAQPQPTVPALPPLQPSPLSGPSIASVTITATPPIGPIASAVVVVPAPAVSTEPLPPPPGAIGSGGGGPGMLAFSPGLKRMKELGNALREEPLFGPMTPVFPEPVNEAKKWTSREVGGKSWLFLGNKFNSANQFRLANAGVQFILNVSADAPNFFVDDSEWIGALESHTPANIERLAGYNNRMFGTSLLASPASTVSLLLLLYCTHCADV